MQVFLIDLSTCRVQIYRLTHTHVSTYFEKGLLIDTCVHVAFCDFSSSQDFCNKNSYLMRGVLECTFYRS